MKARIVHAERLEHACVEKRAQALPGHRLHHAPQRVAGQAVLPGCAGLVGERRCGQTLGEFGGRETARVEVNHVRAVKTGLRVGVFDRCVVGHLTIGQPRRVAEQIMHGDGARGGHQFGDGRAARVGAVHGDLHAGKFRQVTRHRIGELQLAFFHQNHGGE